MTTLRADILRAVQDFEALGVTPGGPLLAGALNHRGRSVSSRTVGRELVRMVADGVLVQERRGVRLVDGGRGDE